MGGICTYVYHVGSKVVDSRTFGNHQWRATLTPAGEHKQVKSKTNKNRERKLLKFTPASPCIAKKGSKNKKNHERRRRIVKKQGLVWSLLFHNDQSKSVTPTPLPELFIGTIQILIENFSHGEHVDSILLEDSPHSIVAQDLAAITGVLKFVLANVLPNLFDSLGS